MKKILSIICATILAVLMNSVSAQDFIYKPVNPFFGGDVFNYQQLLSSANAQNTIEEESASFDRFERDPLSDFEESLNRQILNNLSRALVESQFGEGGLQEGTYLLGNYRIDVTEGDDGIRVEILDESTGNQTTVLIPFF
jgi:curli production assembly/transport component CsgF